ncbi:hypothetical protein D3C74_169010 [compost metagenome]
MTSSIGGSISTFKGTEKTIEKSIIVNERTFQRIEYSVGLRPGSNPWKFTPMIKDLLRLWSIAKY